MQHFTKWIVFSYEIYRNTKTTFMNTQKHAPGPWPLILVAVLALGAIAWAGTGGSWQQTMSIARIDSVPPAKQAPAKKKKPKIDIDTEVNIECAPDHLHIDLHGLHETLESIDWAHIEREIERSTQAILDNVTIPELNFSDVKVNINGVDVEQIQNEVEEAVQQAVTNIDLNEVNAEVENSLDDLHIELNSRSSQEDIRREKAIRRHGALLEQLEDDELISAGKDFELEYRDRNLYVNGKKQSPKTAERYRKYFRNGHTRLLYKNGRFTSR